MNSDSIDSAGLLLDYTRAFDAWRADMQLSGRMREETSAGVYAHMWSALSRWCVAERLGIESLTPQRLDDYLASRSADADLSSRYAWRLLRLVERVLAHRSRRQRARVITAATDLMARRPDIRYANAQDADPLPDSLSPAQARRLVTCLLGRLDPQGVPLAWQALRNRAAVGLQLGCGLTPSEVRALQVEDLAWADAFVRPQGGGPVSARPLSVRVRSDQGARQLPLPNWSARALGAWLLQRDALSVPGNMVFPSTRSSGKPWGKVAQYESVKSVLAAAGIDALEGGSFRLRHTYALRQLRRGFAPEQIAQWLGVSDPGVMARYQRAADARVDAQVDSAEGDSVLIESK